MYDTKLYTLVIPVLMLWLMWSHYPSAMVLIVPLFSFEYGFGIK